MKSYRRVRIAATLILCLYGLTIGFANCSPADHGSASGSGLSAQGISLSPQSTTIAVSARLKLVRGYEDNPAPMQFVIVSGAGSIDSTTGIYMAPDQPTNAVVGLSSGGEIYATANIMVSADLPSTLTTSPAVMDLGVGDTAAVTVFGLENSLAFETLPANVARVDAAGMVTALSPGSAQVIVKDLNGHIGITKLLVHQKNKTVITASGDFTVPPGVRLIHLKAWGGGGGAGGNDIRTGGAGGGGAFAETEVSVAPGDKLTIAIGGGGGGGVFWYPADHGFALAGHGAGGANGGGNGGDVGANGGSGGGGGGGGATTVKMGPVFLLAAGGGGGGGGSGASTDGGPGGAGGTNGGTHSAGDSGGSTGASGGFAGGVGESNGTDSSANDGGGGGGGGAGLKPGFLDAQFQPGGGTGGTAAIQNNADYDEGGGGGGGGASTGKVQAGNGPLPGNPNDPDRGSAGNGGTPSAVHYTASPNASGGGGPGAPGAVVISW